MNSQRNDVATTVPTSATCAAEDALRVWLEPTADVTEDAAEPDGGELADAMAYLAERERP